MNIVVRKVSNSVSYLKWLNGELERYTDLYQKEEISYSTYISEVSSIYIKIQESTRETSEFLN